jgi:RHS repeat-associated protein
MDRRLKKAKVLYRSFHPSERAVEQDPTSTKRKSASPAWAEQQSRRACNHVDKSTVGASVNAVTGEVILTQVDFTLPGRIPLVWTRHYGSNNPYDGMLGKGWQTPADARLEVDAKGIVTFYDGGPGGAVFGALPTAEPVMAASDGAMLSQEVDQYRIRRKSGVTYRFSKTIGNGPMTVAGIGDASGNVLTFVRDDKGALIRICGPGGRCIEVTSDRGRIRAMRMGDRLLAGYRYDDQQLIAALDAMGRPRRYAYANRRMTRRTDINQLCFRYAYDVDGRCLHAWGDGGLYECRLDHRPHERRVTVTDAVGHHTTYTYDDDGLPIMVQAPDGTATAYAYDAVGRVICVTDPLERTTRYVYDAAGNRVEIQRPDDSRIRMVYDADNRPVQVYDANGRSWAQRFDEQGRRIEKTDPLGSTLRYHYDHQGDLTAITDPQGHTTAYEYDDSGLPVARIDPENRTTRFQRDLLGHITAAIDAQGKVSRYIYNDAFFLIQSVPATGHCQHFAWDGEGNLLEHTDAAGLQTRFDYGGVNNIIRRFNADGTTVAYAYDAQENLTGVTNERGETCHLAYDHAGRVVAQTDYHGQTTRHTYDAAGQLIRSVDPMNRAARFDYDAAGRLRTQTFGNEKWACFHWDAGGNLIGFQSPGAIVARIYDAANRLIAEKSGDFVVEYQYDRTGRRTRRTTSNGNTIQYAYDKTGAVSCIRINDQAEVTIRRDRLGRIVHEQLSQEMERTFGYDEAGLLSWQLISDRSGQIHRTFDYDASGNLLAKTDSQKGGWRLGYDPMGRIIEARDPEGRIQRFGYDPAGDLLDHLPLAGRRPRSARYNQTEYRFDASGNLVERQDDDGPTRFSWDGQNHLVTARTPDDGRIDMTYDALGRRHLKMVNGDRTFFHWDGDALLCEQFENGPAREYVYYPGTFEPLAVIDGDGSLYYYHNDLNGLPLELTRPNGELVWSATYDALGREGRILMEAVAQPLRMQGQYWDPETALCYSRHRYFDPRTCSYISPNPLGLAAGENFYAYAPNVWGWVDPLGLGFAQK